MIGLIYPGINMNAEMNDIIDGWHESIVKYNGSDPIVIPTSAAPTSPTILNSDPNLTGNFGGHPLAYRYQIALYKVSANNSDTLANQIVAVWPSVFIFAPRNTTTTPAVSSFEWNIPAPPSSGP